MNAERDSRRALKITAIVVGVLAVMALLAVGVMTGLHRLVDAELLERELTATVSDATGGLYEVTVDEIDFSLTRGSFEARGVVFLPDEERLEELRREEHPRVRYRISAPLIRADGVGRWALLRHRRLDARTVSIIDPVVELRVGPPREAVPEDPPEEDPPTFHRRLWRDLPGIRLDRLSLVNARLEIERPEKPQRIFDRLDSIYVTLHEVHVDSVSAVDEGRTLFSRDVEFHMPAQQRQSADGVYVYHLGETNGSSRDGTMNISSLRFEPVLDDAAYRAQLPYRSDRIRLSTGEISVTGVDYRAFLDERKIVAALMEVSAFDIDVLTDFRLPEPPVTIPRMPDEHFRRIGTYVRLEQIRFTGANIAYNEIAEDGTRPGTVSFEDVSATVHNVTNDADRMTPGSPAVIEARARLFGAGDLRTRIRYPLLTEELTLSCSGTLGPIPLSAFNDMLVPAEGIEVTGGELDSLSFQVEIVAGRATGTVRPVYRDLNVQILDKADESRDLIDRIRSFVLNLLVVRSSNVPEDGEPPRTGEIDHAREPEDSFFRYLWVSLRSGIFDVLGI